MKQRLENGEVRMLSLPERHRRDIVAHAQEAWPRECCGFLVGRGGLPRRVEGVRRLVNQCPRSVRDGFEIDPLDWLRVERGLEPAQRVIGIYHSHPEHADQPSERDRVHAHPNMSYVIASMRGGEVSSMRSWRLDERGVFREEPLGEDPQPWKQPTC